LSEGRSSSSGERVETWGSSRLSVARGEGVVAGGETRTTSQNRARKSLRVTVVYPRKAERLKRYNSRVVSGHDELAAHDIQLMLALQGSRDVGSLGGTDPLRKRGERELESQVSES